MADTPAARRALRTAGAVRAGAGRVWPHWLERQLDPASAAFVAGGALPLLENLTTRSWTVVGNVGSPHQATVDPRGLVTPWPGGWSLDWWVGAEDRWHLPSREAAVRQRLVADAPVVETAMRVPGGDILHRAYAVRAAGRDGGGELLVVEVENATPVPVAIAVALRPYGPEGVASIGRIDLGAPTVASVDGHVALLLPRAPNRAAGSAFADGDVADTVLEGRAGSAFPAGLRCEAGMASAAFVYPLPHRATMSFAMPLAPPGQARRRTRPPPVPDRLPATLPSATQVANGWKAHAGQGMRLVLPDVRLTAAVEANRRSLLVLHDGDGEHAAPTTAGPSPGAAAVLGALDRYGRGDDVSAVLAAYPSAQRRDGSFDGPEGRSRASAAALHAVADHWRLHHDGEALDGFAPVVAAAAEWLDRTWRAAAGGQGSGGTGEGPGPVDALWAVRGLLDAADVLEPLGEHGAAEAARRSATVLLSGVDASLAADAARSGSLALGPGGAAEEAIGALVACSPLGLIAADDPRMAATVELVREHGCHGPACVGAGSRAGLDTEATLRLASVELAAGDRRALDRLAWLLSVATPTWTWAEAVHPRLDGGCGGDGHHRGTVAALLRLVRDLLVREDGHGGLALCSLVPPDWLGQPIEVHDAPTAFGRVSYAVRWHGDRPALLWELDPHDDAAAVRLSAPGLDATWSTTEHRGDALLAPVPPPPPAEEAGTDPPAPVTPVRLSPRRPRA